MELFLRREFTKNVLNVKRVSDGVMFNVVSRYALHARLDRNLHGL